ncbi:MAG: ABC transporter permease [Candidatus Bipolaricaulota bacterium]|nr:ABC transporter permease [Candidatus Bipolaricaulota bacterium]
MNKSSYVLDAWRHMRRNPTTVVGLVIIACFVVMAALGPSVSPHDPLRTNAIGKLQAPSSLHPFGTDQLGRDILSRVLYGARISLWVALLAPTVAGLIGITLGLTAGYLGGKVDNVIMRITDMFMAFPQLILAMAISAALGPNLQNAIVAVALTEWTFFARLSRSRAIEVREEEFIEAARAMGAGRLRILFCHVLPVSVSVLIVQLTLAMGTSIRTAASLGFLGLGAQPPSPEWGVMITAGRNYLPGQWWVSTFPGIAIFFVILGFNLLGDGIRDVLDPRLRK